MDKTKAFILFSGGQDSATCLAWALDRYDYVETVGFNYDQRHSIEMECRKVVLENVAAAFPEWGAKLGEDHIVDLSALGAISETSLTRDVEIKMTQEGLPDSFVPGSKRIAIPVIKASAVSGLTGVMDAAPVLPASFVPRDGRNTLHDL